MRVPQTFADLEFDGNVSSAMNINDIHSVVMYAAARGTEYSTIGVPSSLPEEAAIHVEAQGEHNTNNYMITRTPLFHFRKKKGGHIYIAASDSANPASNILIARSEEATEGFRDGNVWTQDRDGLVDLMLSAAKDAGREARTPETRQPYTQSLKGGARSDAAHDPILRVLFGDAQPAYAAWLSEKGYDNLYAWFATNPLAGLTPKQVGVRPVGLGYGYRNGVGADDSINYNGRSRAVACAEKNR
jgi:hypothetical protein